MKHYFNTPRSSAVFLLLISLFSSVFFSISFADAPPSLGGSPQSPLPPSKIIESEVNVIYNASDSVQVAPAQGINPPVMIQPWKDANALMNYILNVVQDIQVKGINENLYLQYLTPQSGNATSPYDDLFTNHYYGACAQSSTNEGNAANAKCQTDTMLQHGDLKVSSVLDGFVYQNPDREIMARLFVNNLINPFPSEILRDPNSLSADKIKDPGYRKQVAEALADQAVLSVAREPFAEMVAKRKQVSAVSNSSMMQVMEKEAAQRFLNAAWQQKMQKNIENALNKNKPEQAVLYEMAMMQAYQNWMVYQQYRQMERVEALLSALVSVEWRAAKAAGSVVSTAQSQAAAAVAAGKR